MYWCEMRWFTRELTPNALVWTHPWSRPDLSIPGWILGVEPANRHTEPVGPAKALRCTGDDGASGIWRRSNFRPDYCLSSWRQVLVRVIIE